jgi:hypothetical protein
MLWACVLTGAFPQAIIEVDVPNLLARVHRNIVRA